MAGHQKISRGCTTTAHFSARLRSLTFLLAPCPANAPTAFPIPLYSPKKSLISLKFQTSIVMQCCIFKGLSYTIRFFRFKIVWNQQILLAEAIKGFDQLISATKYIPWYTFNIFDAQVTRYLMTRKIVFALLSPGVAPEKFRQGGWCFRRGG